MTTDVCLKKHKPRFVKVLLGFMFLLVINLQYAQAYDGGDFKDDLAMLGKEVFLPLIAIAGAGYLIGKVISNEDFHWIPKVIMTIFLVLFVAAASTMFPDPIGSTMQKGWSQIGIDF